MPDDVGDQPFVSGEEPEKRDHDAADDQFAAVVLDEAFVRAAEIHEPTAVERILAAAQSRAEAEGQPAHEEGFGSIPGVPGVPGVPGAHGDYGGLEHEGYFDRSDYGRYAEDPGWPRSASAYEGPDPYLYGPLRPYRGHARWQRPVAWVLAVVMGVGVVALALTAVYRGAAGQRQPSPPPATTGVDTPPDAPGSPPRVTE